MIPSTWQQYGWNRKDSSFCNIPIKVQTSAWLKCCDGTLRDQIVPTWPCYKRRLLPIGSHPNSSHISVKPNEFWLDLVFPDNFDLVWFVDELLNIYILHLYQTKKCCWQKLLVNKINIGMIKWLKLKKLETDIAMQKMMTSCYWSWRWFCKLLKHRACYVFHTHCFCNSAKCLLNKDQIFLYPHT